MFRIFRNTTCLQAKNWLTRITLTQRNRSLANGSQTTKGTPDSTSGPPPVPPPPELCCRSGCQNCVWLDYVNDMIKYYKNNKDEAKKALDEIPDESIKAFIRMELRL